MESTVAVPLECPAVLRVPRPPALGYPALLLQVPRPPAPPLRRRTRGNSSCCPRVERHPVGCCRNDIAPLRRSAVCAAAGLRWSATPPAQGATSSYDCTGVLISVPIPVVEYARVPPEYPLIEPSALPLPSRNTPSTRSSTREYPRPAYASHRRVPVAHPVVPRRRADASVSKSMKIVVSCINFLEV